MARQKRRIDATVLEEAKRRLHHIYEMHDSVAVCFSGGKDSLAALHLTWEVAQERGLTHVEVIHRDEEFIPSVVVDFVQGYRNVPWVRLHYFCVPLRSSRYVLGVVKEYVQWDEARPHVREAPAWAIRLRPNEHVVLDQFTGDDYFVGRAGLRGKVALVTGIRASESLMRYRASVNKLNDNYINASSSPRVALCKPLYDWEENDIFRYFYDRDIPYCPIYDRQLWADVALRVATPMVSETAKHLHKLASIDPVLYEQVMTAFPEMAVQARYYREARRNASASVARYAHSWAGIREWVEEYLDPASQMAALRELKSIQGRAVANPQSYPFEYVLKAFMAGGWKKRVMPLPEQKGKTA